MSSRLRRLAPSLAGALACLALTAACGNDTTTSTSTSASSTGAVVAPSIAPVAVPTGLPFTFQGGGQGGSPPFTIPSAGNYTAAYHLSADANGGACTMSIALTHDADSVTVLDQTQVAPGAPKDGTKSLKLAAGTWRAIEGGGCAWTLTVSP